jgi:prepilin-type N-terminal cleavage/methylation domain-containing protein
MTAKKTKKNNPGFSLVEMIIVAAISAIIAMAVAQIFLTGVKTFETNKGMQKNLEEARVSMEMMSKNIRMSKYTVLDSDTIYMYNTSQGQCMSYRFNSVNKVLEYAYCSPKTDDGTTSGNPVGSDDDPGTVCQGSGGVCFGGSAYSYNNLAQSNIIGKFDVTPTNRNPGAEEIGRATISMTVGNGTDLQQTIQSSVSFRDYDDIIQ